MDSLILDAGCRDSWSEWDHMFTLRSWTVVYMLLRPDRDGQSYPCPRVKLSTQALAEHTPVFRLIYLPLECPCAATFVAGYLTREVEKPSGPQQFYALSRQPDLRRLPSLLTARLSLITSGDDLPQEDEEEEAEPEPVAEAEAKPVAPAQRPPPMLGHLLQSVLADPEMLTALHRLMDSAGRSDPHTVAPLRRALDAAATRQ